MAVISILYRPFLEKCLEILDEYDVWKPSFRNNDRRLRCTVTTKRESDHLYWFEIGFYYGMKGTGIKIIGGLHHKGNHVRVVGRSRVSGAQAIFLMIYGCIAMGLTIIFASTPLFIMGFFWSVMMIFVLYQTLIERYRLGNYPETWLKGRGLPQPRMADIHG